MTIGKPVMTTKHPGVMEEFGEDNGVIYVDRPEDALYKAVKLIGDGNIKKEGRNARRFVDKYNWQDLVDEFVGLLEEVVNGPK